MRRFLALIAFVATTASPQKPFTLQQILSAPYSTNLTAAPVGSLFAWVEDAEGRHNLWVAGPNTPARQLTHYTEDDAQDIASLAWSPDGKTIAYVYGAETGASGRPANPAHLQRPTPVEIILQPVDGSAPTVLGDGHAPLFSPDGKSLFFVRSGQIFIADLAALRICALNKNCHPERSLVASSRDAAEGPAMPLAPGTRSGSFTHQVLFDRGSASALTLSPDGKILAYISHRRTHSFLALFNLETKTLTFPAPSTGDDSAPIFSRDGKYLAWLRFPFTDPSEFAGNRTSPNPWSIQIDDLSTNQTRTLFQPEPNQPGSAEPRMSTGEPHLYWTAPLAPTTDLSSRPKRSAVERPAVSSSGSLLFFSEADGWVHLYSIDPSGTKPPVLLTPGKFEVQDATLDAENGILLFSANFDGYNPLDRDRRHIMSRLIPNPSVEDLGIEQGTSGPSIETHPVVSGGQIAALVSDARTPMHPALIQSPLGANPAIITPLHPDELPMDYPAAQLVTPTQIIFPSSDNLFQLHGQLFLPKFSAPAGTKHPAILFFHGGPKRQMLLGYPAMDYYSNAYAMNQYLASRGYIVLSVNYRGGIGYGLDFRQCQHCGADGAAEYNDVLGAVAYLRSRPDVDTAHIGIWGGSYGGYLTALALARNSDLFAAGVDFHGVHEWAREDNARSDWLDRPGTTLEAQEKIAALAHASSPMADIAKWKSPVLLIHGDDDPEVAYTQTPMLADALRARNVHVEELIFPDEVHGFLLHKDWLAAYQAAANFFDRTLKPSSISPVPPSIK
ncbi:MAG TPA: prolyl oligopeptidase family serine peptidase [Acidobacteriaceae bacterium]|nr:prolyl oligopeptidase family serine peptidase [Acidobacteriaceae bacterium]